MSSLQVISIHSPHTRGDDVRLRSFLRGNTISIHSPHTRGDVRDLVTTPLAGHFNPLPSYEGRLRAGFRLMLCGTFQSTPLIRGETGSKNTARPTAIFQSTPLIRGETACGCYPRRPSAHISIHSPHTRGDSISLQKSIRIYISLHNKVMIHRFSGLYKSLFCGAKPDIRGAKPLGMS